ncbi:MAG: TIM barrel protein [Bryobacterales bacterium]
MGRSPLRVLAEKAAGWGYDGLELACWGDHMDVFQAAESLDYCAAQKAILAEHGLELFAISNHLPGQLTSRPQHRRAPDAWPPRNAQLGDLEKKRAQGIESIKTSACAAKNLGTASSTASPARPSGTCSTVFPGSRRHDPGRLSIACRSLEPHLRRAFDDCGVRFAYEVRSHRSSPSTSSPPIACSRLSAAAKRSASTST